MFLSSVESAVGLKNDNDEKHPALGKNKQALELLVQQRFGLACPRVRWNLQFIASLFGSSLLLSAGTC
jgi:hypothetical protein